MGERLHTGCGYKFGTAGSACAPGTYVASVTECERAAVMLGQTDTSVYQSSSGGVDNPANPHGCYILDFDHSDNSGRLNFNVNTAKEGKDLTSKERVPVCRGKLPDKLVPTY